MRSPTKWQQKKAGLDDLPFFDTIPIDELSRTKRGLLEVTCVTPRAMSLYQIRGCLSRKNVIKRKGVWRNCTKQIFCGRSRQAVA